jgi:hypothetical protein
LIRLANNGNNIRLLTPSCEISNKFVTALMGNSGTWGKLIPEKPEVKNLVALSLLNKNTRRDLRREKAVEYRELLYY